MKNKCNLEANIFCSERKFIWVTIPSTTTIIKKNLCFSSSRSKAQISSESRGNEGSDHSVKKDANMNRIFKVFKTNLAYP